MPRRNDIDRILVLGSGPIVIGQAAEFDYSGAQACKVLLEEGYEVVLVNSNPATIMTDPEFATATYIEPLTPDSVARVIERERPDALLPTLGGGTALNLARALSEDGTLERFGVELIGADYDAIRRAEDRDLFRQTMEKAGLRVPRSAIVSSIAEADRALPDIGLPAIIRPGLHDGRPGRRSGLDRGRVRRAHRRGSRRQPDRPGAGGGVRDRLGRVRARGDARPERQRGDRLLDRERRPDGRPHRGQRHRGAAADAHRPPVPEAARPGDRGHPRGRRRDRRLEHPVRGEPADRRDRGDRDEPARLALVRARVQGHRLPDRQDRGAPGGGLRARRDRQRHHEGHPGQLRADHRLRGGEVAALRLREVPRHRRPPLHPHAVGRRGDGDRAHVQAGAGQGDALARDRREGAAARGHRGAEGAAAGALLRPLRAAVRGRPPRGQRGRDRAAHAHRPLVRGRACGPRPRGGSRGRPGAQLQVGGHLRGRVRRRHALLLLGLRAPGPGRPRPPRGAPRRAAVGRDPRRRPEPHRAGHRVRLLLRARRDDRARLGPRRGDDQLQPRDGLHRLRHQRPPLLRAADAGGRARRDRGRAAGGRDRPVRRPDPAQAGARPGGRGRAAARHPRRLDRPGRGPRPLRRPDARSRAEEPAVRHRRLRGGRARGCRAGGLPAARPPLLRARRPGDGALLLARAARRLPASAPSATATARSTSTASSRTRSRSTWTRSATASRSRSAA